MNAQSCSLIQNQWTEIWNPMNGETFNANPTSFQESSCAPNNFIGENMLRRLASKKVADRMYLPVATGGWNAL